MVKGEKGSCNARPKEKYVNYKLLQDCFNKNNVSRYVDVDTSSWPLSTLSDPKYYSSFSSKPKMDQQSTDTAVDQYVAKGK